MAASMACHCGCSDPHGGTVHAIASALADEDLDRAIDAGLLDADACPRCTPACTATLMVAREARIAALAARERFRAREARLTRRQHERNERRGATTSASQSTNDGPPPALPPAAAAALARAKARAAGRSPG